MLTLPRRGLQLFILAAMLLLSTAFLQAQDKQTSPETLKIGFLMDSLKIERWQTDLEKFQKRAMELGAEVLVETAEGDDELQLQQAQRLLTAGVRALVLVSHDAEKAVRIVSAAKAKKVPLLCYERLVRNPDVTLFIGVDASVVGYLQASSLTQLAPKGNYVIIGGSPSDINAKFLHDGQMLVLKPLVARGDIKIVSDTWSKDWEPSEAYAHMSAAIESTKGDMQSSSVGSGRRSGRHYSHPRRYPDHDRLQTARFTSKRGGRNRCGVGKGRSGQGHEWICDWGQNDTGDFPGSGRSGKRKCQGNRDQRRLPESRNDSEEPAEGEMAAVDANQPGKKTVISGPKR
jgi:hypothetical protein